MRVFYFGLLLALCFPLQAQVLVPDDASAARKQLEQLREELSAKSGQVSASDIKRMMELGLWDQATNELQTADEGLADTWLLRAELAWLKHDFFTAEQQVAQALRISPKQKEVKLWEARLAIEAWELKHAEKSCLQILRKSPREIDAILLLGKLALLRKDYAKALALAEQVQSWTPEVAEGYLLEADAHVWNQQLEKAEPALRRCLELNPFLADARFAYGYALWRRVDATLLPAMAAQWELALAVNPLHFSTHWHWGNGHTHLTYQDYLDPQETEIRLALAPADRLLAENRAEEALTHIRTTAQVYPNSVLSAMQLGSSFYVTKELGEQRLDSAQGIFLDILQQKAHYGPAHNGLAAVLKQRRFAYLHQIDSLEAVITNTEIADPENFFAVFSDLDQYPGSRVPKMVWSQLYSSVVYLPFLKKLNRNFVIPPLHQDLALAMNNSYFRGATTFDNRQWMDIRGVGSGATGIEYVERGAHLERNVTLHEYVHLFHGSLFTDAEMREVRARYYEAMEKGFILDYYSANNEFEYLAQTFTAYFLPIKVHPLNHKSLNTRSDLMTKDPKLFAFLDQLVKKQKAYLAGDRQAMAETWAEVYLQLSEETKAIDLSEAYLDTALQWAPQYLPALLAQAAHQASRQQFSAAKEWLQQAIAIDSSYAPTFLAYADLSREQFRVGEISESVARQEIRRRFRQAESLETDWQLRAELNRDLRQHLLEFGQVLEAIEAAESYASSAPTVSTYLRDQKLAAEAFAWEQRGLLGYVAESLPFFAEQVAQRPQDYRLLLQYARLLRLEGSYAEADSVLLPAHRLLAAAGSPRADVLLALAENALASGDTAQAHSWAEPARKGEVRVWNRLDWIGLLIQLGDTSTAQAWFAGMVRPTLPDQRSQYEYARALLQAAAGEEEIATLALVSALKANPYHFPARMRLIHRLIEAGEKDQARSWARQGVSLPLPAGPVWRKQLAPFVKAE